MFCLDDQLNGSPYKDKLNGYTGDDFIDGNQGNDKLKGGPGLDTFYFQAFDGRDVIKDFKWQYDTIQLDSSLATNMNQSMTQLTRTGRYRTRLRRYSYQDREAGYGRVRVRTH